MEEASGGHVIYVYIKMRSKLVSRLQSYSECLTPSVSPMHTQTLCAERLKILGTKFSSEKDSKKSMKLSLSKSDTEVLALWTLGTLGRACKLSSSRVHLSLIVSRPHS